MRNSSWNSILIQSAVSPARFILFETKSREILVDHQVDIAGSEYENFLKNLESCCQEGWADSRNLDTIVFVTGPASFTGWRIGSLTVNTFAFASGIPLVAITLFEYWELGGLRYPMILEANRSECIIKENHEAGMRLVNRENIPEGNYSGILKEELARGKILLQWQEKLDLPKLLKHVNLDKTVSRVETLYLKKPNITISSKHHGPNRS